MNAKVILIGLMTVVAANAYSSGAPDKACIDMAPKHSGGSIKPQTSIAPYEVKLSKNELRSGDTVDVTIHGFKRSDTIQGFMVQGRVGDTPVNK